MEKVLKVKNETISTLNSKPFSDSLTLTDQRMYVFSLITFELIMANALARMQLGCTSEELSNYTFLDLFGDQSNKYFQSFATQLRTGQIKDTSFSAYLKESNFTHNKPVKVALQLIQGNEHPLCFAIITDSLAENTNVEKDIFVPNSNFLLNNTGRSLFYERLENAIHLAMHQNSMVCILLLDLDRFKNINHSFGKKLGDAFLKLIEDRLRVFVRENDTISHFEGDEFLFIFPSIPSISVASRITERILHSFSKPFQINEHELFITPSIGMAIYPYDGVDVETLVNNAEKAMYKAKENGGNTYHIYNTDMKSNTYEKLVLENDLRKAIARNEFILYFQPLVDIKTDRIVSMEALIRWNHPSKGMVSPFEFIPLAEEIGLIDRIGYWVMKEACKRLKELHDLGHTFVSMSINIAAPQFKNKDFQNRLVAILNENKLNPNCLTLEITESSAMEHSNKFIELFNQLKGKNIKIAIDDFGTGYSSLSYLKQLNTDTLKIDRSFVKEICSSVENKVIVKAIIQLAHALGIKVVAEGVETQEQLEILRSLDCDIVQGYFISVPLPFTEVREFLCK
ncbi:putative bifunctional diguanylate cyclase/phosphodiesterase [Bacillus pinisoli]|uniref:putative bifunctional diguanylate cyclase/phosphodiesterase n=1 Tax=Bacillus pinisoli TaxID=2901866 RepID=UPI001FF4F072|nr:bifunctional diguanylate cyclase/phosphodiesterase [Bacillus pinisoli]